MMTRSDLAQLSEQLENEMVLTVYIAKENEDPGMGDTWKRRLTSALSALRADVEHETPGDLVDFDRASESVMSGLESFGRILPHEGWCAFATAGHGVRHAEPLSYGPPEMARWRQGLYVAPYIRSFKSKRPVVLGLVDRWHAQLRQFQDGELSSPVEFAAEKDLADVSDVGVGKRASAGTGTRGASGMRGMTGTDFAQRSQTEEAKRLRTQVVDALKEMCGDTGAVVVGGTPEAVGAVRKELEGSLPGRVMELSELSFQTEPDELIAQLRQAASRLTEDRQAQLLETCGDPRRGSNGWNETYRALAAGAVDTLLVARGMIADAPDDAERLVRLALAQGGELEEVGGELGERLMAGNGGVSARLRFLPASLKS